MQKGTELSTEALAQRMGEFVGDPAASDFKWQVEDREGYVWIAMQPCAADGSPSGGPIEWMCGGLASEAFPEGLMPAIGSFAEPI